MLLSESCHILFVHIPKTAGQSVHAALCLSPKVNVLSGHAPSSMKNEWNYDHAKAWRIREYLEDQWNDYFKFSFVRNPWSWLVSMFSYARQSVVLDKSQELETVKWAERMREFKDFAEFAHCTEMLPEGQYQWITDNHNPKHIIVDAIYRFENIQSDFKMLSERIGIEVNLPHIEPSVHDHYSAYYSDGLRDKIGEHYKTDVEMFNYEFVDRR